ncbi:MAG TPA: helix-turn-helix domain-containing protein [Micromonosporaceae bacterium]
MTPLLNTGDQRPTTGKSAGDKIWTIESVRTLGTTTDVETAAAILGIGRTKAYELAKAGEFPVKIIRVGRRYIVPIPALLTALDST